MTCHGPTRSVSNSRSLGKFTAHRSPMALPARVILIGERSQRVLHMASERGYRSTVAASSKSSTTYRPIWRLLAEGGRYRQCPMPTHLRSGSLQGGHLLEHVVGRIAPRSARCAAFCEPGHQAISFVPVRRSDEDYVPYPHKHEGAPTGTIVTVAMGDARIGARSLGPPARWVSIIRVID